MRKSFTQTGFSLVELMVVIAIIAILTVIAIPQYDKYKSKALVPEAKIALGAIYQNEIAFFQEAQMYAACLNAIGYASSPNAYYAKGFYVQPGTAPDPVNFGCQNGNSGAYNPLGLTYTYFVADKTARTSGTPAAVVDMPPTTITATGFTASAGGFISKDSLLTDKWTINEQQAFVHLSIGY